MLEIKRILREAHKAGECRWGCPGCAEEKRIFVPGTPVELVTPDGCHLYGAIVGFIDLQGKPDPATGAKADGLWSVDFTCADGTLENLWLLGRDIVLRGQ
jgi:hypothetical protein